MTIAIPKNDPRVTDGKDHYPLTDQSEAASALARLSQQDSPPGWFTGSLSDLKTTVLKAARSTFPQMKIPTPIFNYYAEVQTWDELRSLLQEAVDRRYNPAGREPNVYLRDVRLDEQAVILMTPEGPVQVKYDLDEERKIVLDREETPMKKSWVEAYADEIETVDIPDVEIFAGGTNTTREFTEDRVRKLVEASIEVFEELKPAIFPGHTRKVGFPNVGQLKNIRQKGMKIVSDLINVPKVMAKWIQSKGYNRVSPEIRRNYIAESGKAIPEAICGLALLGQDVPKIKTIADLPFPVYADEDPDVEVFCFAVDDNNTIITDGGERTMPEQDNKGRTTVPVDVQEYAELVQAKQRLTELKAVEAQIEEYSETIKTQKADIAKLEGQVKEYSEKIEGMEKAQTKTKIDSTLERMKKAGKLQPAKESEVREFAETLDDSEIREYAEGVKATQLDRYLGQLEAKAEGSVINFSEKSTKGPDKKPAVDAEDDSEFAARVQEYAEKNGCSFEDAIDKVATPEDEDAHQARIR
jgi:hypothetical protein